MSKTRKSIKILNWQKEGFVLYNKKLELGRYHLPSSLNKDAYTFTYFRDVIQQLGEYRNMSEKEMRNLIPDKWTESN